MKQREVSQDLLQFPPEVRPFLCGARLLDSSCSPAAQVWHAVGEEDLYLKRSRPGTLRREAAMTRWMHEKGMAAEVLLYLSGESDWLVTRALAGEDGIAERYLLCPERLCRRMGELLRELHEGETAGCPVPDRTGDYLIGVEAGIAGGIWSPSRTVEARFSWKDRQEAVDLVREWGGALRRDTLIHGDFCLPNVMMNDWRLSGYIDLDNAGVGDRHIDLYWMVWSLTYNLKDGRWGDLFLDAYGREAVQPDLLRTVAACECFG